MASHNITQEKEAKTMPAACKMGTVFWNATGCILVKFCHKQKPSMQLFTFRHSTSCAVHCVTTVQGKDHPATQHTVPYHFSLYREAFNNCWKLLTHPPYSLDLAPSNNHLFQFSKNQM